MKKQIRNSVFETNSSSSHSLTLDRDNFVMDTSLVPENGVVIVTDDGEYGWEWFKNNDAYTKLQYAVQDNCKELCEQAIKKQLGAELIVHTPKISSDSWSIGGYIDHDSVGNVSGTITTVDEMISFIFNKNSWLFGGNDNGGNPYGFYDVELYKDDGSVQQVVYGHKLIIEGVIEKDKVKENLQHRDFEGILSEKYDYSNRIIIDGNKYSDYDFDLDTSFKTITFKRSWDDKEWKSKKSDIDSTIGKVTNDNREEYRKLIIECQKSLRKTLPYEISKR